MQEKAESALQLFSRIKAKTYLEGFNSKLFGEQAPKPNTVIELLGNNWNDRVDILIDSIIRCILPSSLNPDWKDCGAILIITEFHINIFRIVKAINFHLKALKVQNTKEVIEKALKNLTIFKCFDKEQMEITFFNIERIILKNDNISLVVIDSLDSNYWLERNFNDSLSFYGHSLECFNTLYKLIGSLNIVLIFGRNSSDVKKRLCPNVDFKVEVTKTQEGFIAEVVCYHEEIAPNSVPFNVVNGIIQF